MPGKLISDIAMTFGSVFFLFNSIGSISGFFVGPIITDIDENFGRRWAYGYTMLIVLFWFKTSLSFAPGRPLECYWNLGSVIAVQVNSGCVGFIASSWSWRCYIIQVPFVLYNLIAVRFVWEVPAFLLAKSRDAEAYVFLVEYHGGGEVDNPVVRFEFKEMKGAILAARDAKSEKWCIVRKKRSTFHRLGLAALKVSLKNLTNYSFPDINDNSSNSIVSS
ncbi:uncharacterized protein C8R40DRAFT_1071089 [Lentinula edodes]|uniref:uncharacterized protein n=1 Tax=Lentinula edodes TaxID=5353 RepID=UPI001E8DF93B|nr:uncharacterized protein C8R40DRAFT_1071089 [Lentinula edodes]KAH7873106.1 hypothetical protein C8R40DRAFT_1071089 [Lentinula edodes]